MDALSLIAAILFLLFLYYLKVNFSDNYWSQFNVPCVPKRLPVFGHFFKACCGKRHVSMICDDIYEQYKSSSMCGIYFLHTPCLLLRDPELIKTVFSNKFSSFQGNVFSIDPKLDPIMAKNPFFNTGDEWKDSRNRLISHFAGKKLRYLYDIVQDVCLNMKAYLSRKIDESQGGVLELELKEFFARATGEVVANAAIGIEGESFKDNPSPLSFSEVQKTIFVPSFVQHILQSVRFFYPKFGNLIGAKFMPQKASDFFTQTLRKATRERKISGARPNDFLQFVMNANGDNEEQIISEVVSFFLDVYETSSIALSFMFYRIANDEQVQENLRREITRVTSGNKGEITYELLKNLDYLEQVLMESMRMNPPLGVFMKICTEEASLEGEDGLTCKLKPGHLVFIPATSLHMDENHWENPQLFNPDRFKSEDRIIMTKNKFTYLPFGEGARICPGRRMSIMMIKLVAFTILQNFLVLPSLTRNKLEIDSGVTIAAMQYAKDGLWARFKNLNAQ